MASILQEPFFPVQLAATSPSISSLVRTWSYGACSHLTPGPDCLSPWSLNPDALAENFLPEYLCPPAGQCPRHIFLPEPAQSTSLQVCLARAFYNMTPNVFSKVSFNMHNFSRNNIIFRLLSSVLPASLSLPVFVEHILMI